MMKRIANLIRKKLADRAGFSMVEIIVALIVFSIGIVALMKLQPSATQTNIRSQQVSKATNLAQEELERLSGLTYNSGDLSNGTHIDPNNPIEDVYLRSWVVVQDNPAPGMKRIDVSVTFPTASSDSVVVITTYLSRF